jgi:DNA-binding Lrp family transcriptional regulator
MAILSVEMYYAHARGASIEAIAKKLGFSEKWVNERIEAARLAIERKVVVCRTAVPDWRL